MERCCPRCDTPTADGICSHHPGAPVLICSRQADYDDFAAVVVAAAGLPLYLPWPLEPDVSLSGLGYAEDDRGRPVATVCTTTGPSALDGDIDLTVVTEEPLVGLGARIAGLAHADPGPTVGDGPAALHVRLDDHHVPLWPVPVEGDEVLQAAAFVGEWEGRWLWVIAHPATSILDWGGEIEIRDAAQFGPEALDLPFGGATDRW